MKTTGRRPIPPAARPGSRPTSPTPARPSAPFAKPQDKPRPPAAKPRPAATAPASPPAPTGRVVYGLHAVAELLRNPRAEIQALFVSRDSAQDEGALAAIRNEAHHRNLTPIERTRGELDRLSQSGVHQGVIALCGAYRYAEGVGELLGRAESLEQAPMLVLLDGVTDPQNLGALVRSTYVLGGHGVIVPRDRSATITPAAAKAAAGATELLPIAQVPNLVRSMEELRENGVWLIAAVAPGQGGQPPWAIDLTQPSALVLGSEGQGLRPLVRKTCDLRVEIPMQRGLHGASLNVANAGAVLLYEAQRQRLALAQTAADSDGEQENDDELDDELHEFADSEDEDEDETLEAEL